MKARASFFAVSWKKDANRFKPRFGKVDGPSSVKNTTFSWTCIYFQLHKQHYNFCTTKGVLIVYRMM
jgi:hypothetical protein